MAASAHNNVTQRCHTTHEVPLALVVPHVLTSVIGDGEPRHEWELHLLVWIHPYSPSSWDVCARNCLQQLVNLAAAMFFFFCFFFSVPDGYGRPWFPSLKMSKSSNSCAPPVLVPNVDSCVGRLPIQCPPWHALLHPRRQACSCQMAIQLSR